MACSVREQEFPVAERVGHATAREKPSLALSKTAASDVVGIDGKVSSQGLSRKN